MIGGGAGMLVAGLAQIESTNLSLGQIKGICDARTNCVHFVASPGSPRSMGSVRPLGFRRRQTYPKVNELLVPYLERSVMGIVWTIIIGLVAGIIAKFLVPGSNNEPSGLVLTAVLGIVGALVATYLGQAIGWYQAGQGAGFIGAIVGAIIVLLVWKAIAGRRGTSTM